jgi:hypothetical protein
LPPLIPLPPPQRENGSGLRVQLCPPSSDVALTSPRAEPFDQRSCCQIPTIVSGRRGLIARCGSTSALT